MRSHDPKKENDLFSMIEHQQSVHAEGKSFDGSGNYAMGVKEQIVFPEIEYDKVDEVRGMDIIVVTSAKSDDEARELLRGIQFPFVNA